MPAEYAWQSSLGREFGEEFTQALPAPAVAPAHRHAQEGPSVLGLDQLEAVAAKAERTALGGEQAAALAFADDLRFERAIVLSVRAR